ncbi:hypothetical protein LTR84_010889 [Exophiala bonariae]|uniref:KANL3/Tex30 alpha/beta hydrolase-like domain-containing protein n=1 Tax=Exophiala bonariae TaxID=1690606 RepID=A0AAV9NHN9_9EURO|nr:hypothetical protein LTR84_010889 [Exophiala bonariae]
MPPKKHATRSSTTRSAAVKDAKTSKGTAGTEQAVASALGRDPATEDVTTKPARDKDAIPKATKPQPSPPPPPRPSTQKTTTPTFTNYTIPGSKNPIPCRRSVHDSGAPPRSPDLIFTHGAGGDLTAAKMVQFSEGFASTGSSIVMFQGNMNLSARAKGFDSVLAYEGSSKDKGREGGDASDVAAAFGGRSMGARAAVVASQARAQAQGQSHGKLLVLASYPLVGQQKGDVRDAILLSLPADTQVLFISGDRDNLCPLPQLESVRAKMKARTWLVTVVGADHGMDLHGGKALKKGTEEVGRECGRIAARWLKERDDKAREMDVWWHGERDRVLGTWGEKKGGVEDRDANDMKGRDAGIKRFFSKVEAGTKDGEQGLGDISRRRNKKMKK